MKLNFKENNFGGKLIVFEGTDGSGKTTLLNFTKEYLDNKKIDNIEVKMPSNRIRNLSLFNDYDNSNDNTIRNLINLEDITIFVSGDRLLSLDTEIIPALKENKIVLCDRYTLTALIKCKSKIIKSISKLFIKPNLVIITTCPFPIIKERIKSRPNEKDNHFDENLVKNEISNFKKLAKDNNYILFDTNKNIEENKTILYKILDELLKK
jgi:dTMP kinase